MKLKPHLNIAFTLSVILLMYNYIKDYVDLFQGIHSKHIVYKVHKMQFIGVDMSRCGCIVRSTHGLPTTSSSLFVLDQAKFQLHGFY